MNTTNTTTHLEFEIECYDFPCATLSPYAHLRLGIQDRDEVKQDVPCSAGNARFCFNLEALQDSETGAVIFRGGYAQGSRDARFVYLCWGVWGEDGWQHFRRAKIPLNGIDLAITRRAIQENRPLKARLRMTDAKGEPVAAMLKAEQLEWRL